MAFFVYLDAYYLQGTGHQISPTAADLPEGLAWVAG